MRLEYLAAVVQHTGESWSNVRITLSTARPSLDAAPPDLLPLRMDVAGAVDTGPIDAHDDRSQLILAELSKPLPLSFSQETPLDDVIAYIKQSTKSTAFPEGIPTYVDPMGLQEADKTMTSTVRNINFSGVPLKVGLELLLRQLDLDYQVKGGLLVITSRASAGESDEEDPARLRVFADGGAGLALEQAQAAGGAMLNREAASDQAAELRVAAGASATTAGR